MFSIRVLGPIAVLYGGLMGGSACVGTADDCVLLGECSPPGEGAASSASGSGGAGGSGFDVEPWGEKCGGYARQGASGGGSYESPAGTLQEAIAAASAKGVPSACACAGGTLEGEATIPPGFFVRGDLDCANGWKPTDGRATLKGGPDEIAIRFEPGAGTTTLRGFTVLAGDAALPGGSSIAALAPPVSDVRIEDCELRGGAAAAGVPGEDAPLDPFPSPIASDPGDAACSHPTQTEGGAPHIEKCPSGDPEVEWATLGGKGGGSATSFGFGGEDGQAVPAPPAPLGEGGLSGLSSCALGGTGANGADGEEGMPGESGAPKGALDPIAGWVGLSGLPGMYGTPGQGGGGGGGQKGKPVLPNKPLTCGGAAGGAGGAGGCGGAGGQGGKPGGSSIALVSIGAKVVAVKTLFASGAAGLGGEGGAGQPGAEGGPGGAGGAGAVADGIVLLAACAGGAGGRGGDGGRGGHGQGGHSAGIAFEGDAPIHVDGVTFDVPFETGTGGIAAPTLAF
jgi:hypothetical protein